MKASFAVWHLGLCALAISACVDSEHESSERAPLSVLHQYEVLIAAPVGTIIEVRERDTNRFIGSAAAGCGSQEGYNWLANTANDGGCVQGLSQELAYVFSVAGGQNHLVYRHLGSDPEENHDVYATFASNRFAVSDRAICTTGCEGYVAYSLTTTANPSSAGTITRTPNQFYYRAAYDDVSLYAQANQGWVFSSWSGGLTGSTNPRAFEMTSNMSVVANFVPAPLAVSISGPRCVAKNSGSHTWTAFPSGGPSSAYTYRWTSTVVSGVIGTGQSITLPYGPGFTLTVTVTSGSQVATSSVYVALCSGPPIPEANDATTDTNAAPQRQ